jgi:RND family efflux transporter MFP subunit
VIAKDWVERAKRVLAGRPALVLTVASGLLLLAPGLARLDPAPSATEADAMAAPAVPAAAAPLASLPEPGAAGVPSAGSEAWFAKPGAAAPAAPSDPGGYECLLEPSARVEIGSPVVARIDRVLVERADAVEAGQVVVELDAAVELAAAQVASMRAEMQGALRSREASAELEVKRRERALKLFDENALSLDAREEVETQARVAASEAVRAHEDQRLAKLEFQRAHADLERRSIRSPIPGVVIERSMSPGEVVDDETILTVAQIDPLRVEALLPAADFGSVRPGIRAAVTPEIPGDEVHVAEVVVVDRVIDPASGTFTVRLELPNPDHAIPSGLHCRVRFLPD